MSGMAKQKLFGKKSSQWPTLQRLVAQGVLLEIDLAYAKEKVPHGTEKEAASYAALLASLRQGHLTVTKETVDPALAPFITEELTLPKYAYFEDEIVSQLKRILALAKKGFSFQPLPQLTIEQNQAVQNALSYPLSIITGGPGTGKTFTASQVVKAFNAETVLTAPTGKAASHLATKVELPCKSATLHSLLKIFSPLDHFKEREFIDAKLIIVDEASMIDFPLFSSLLKSVPADATLVLMGDRNQLPAVSGGSIFSDLINTQQIPTTCLTKCHRSDRKEILDLAQGILDHSLEEIRNVDLGFEKGNIEEIYAKLWDFVKEKDFNFFRILSTLRKGPLGVDALNGFLHEKFAKKTTHFPIMIKKNDPRTGLTNGETGVLIGEEAHFSSSRVFPLHTLPPFEYAYCLSVHKSQGSEYDQVLFLIPEGSEVFGREILYTAVTRARHQLYIDGNQEQIVAALNQSSARISNIIKKLHV